MTAENKVGREGSIPPDLWNTYVDEALVSKRLLPLARRLGIENAYDTYMGLEVYKKTWETTRSLLEEAGEVDGIAVNVGCGPAYHELDALQKINSPNHIIAMDKSDGMLNTLRNKINNNTPQLIDVVTFVNQDASQPWPENIRGVGMFLTNTALCWMTEEERASTIKNTAERMSPGAKAVMQFRTPYWDEAVVKSHIPAEMKANPFRAIAAAIGARKKFTLEVDKMTKEGSLSVLRPTEEEVIELALRNGLELVNRKATFWPGENIDDLGNPELGHGAAMLFVKN